MGGRSDFFLQPLEPRRLLSGQSAPASAADPAHAAPHDAAASPHPSVQHLDEQVAQLRSALSKMAEQMERFDQLRGGGNG
jgi:hypothetical protein